MTGPFRSKTAGAPEGLWLGVVLALLSCLPALVARYPQMSDYPAHLARYHVMLDGGRNADLARYYGFAWQWTGNVGVDLLIRPFAALFGLEAGGRIIVGLIPPLTGFGLLAVEWVLRRRISLASYLAMAFIWSPMMLIGLVNFALGQALLLWVFALWVAMAGNRWRPTVMVPLGVAVWLCHISAWGILGVMVFGHEWARGKNWRAFVAPWPLLGPVAIMVMLPGTASDFSYGAYWWVYKQAIWIKAMRDTSYALDWYSLIAVIMVLAMVALARRFDGRLGWAAALLLVLSLALPRHISGGDYADYRMISSGLMIACLAIDVAVPTLALMAAPALYLLRLAMTTLTWQADSAETEANLAALDHVPMGARVASAVYVAREAWPLNRLEHIGAYAVIRRNALTNANFAVEHIHMLHLKVPYYIDPSHRLLLGREQPLDLAAFRPGTDPAAGSQYLWYVGTRRPDTMPAGATIIWRHGEGFLARLHPPASAPLAKPGKAD